MLIEELPIKIARVKHDFYHIKINTPIFLGVC